VSAGTNVARGRLDSTLPEVVIWSFLEVAIAVYHYKTVSSTLDDGSGNLRTF
jgi:hypothetical protein